MNETNIYTSIPASSGYHTAVLTTYSINFNHFDNQCLRALHSKHINQIHLLTDRRQTDCAVEFSIGATRRLGTDYSVSSIICDGAFHPKICLVLGNDAAMMVAGSGNLSMGGSGKNHEIFTGFMFDAEDATQKPLIVETWHYLARFRSQTAGYAAKLLWQDITSECQWLNGAKPARHKAYDIGNGLEARLLYNDGTTIFSQMAEAIAGTSVSSITVASPFFDSDGALLRLLQRKFNCRVDVLLQSKCTLPPNRMRANDNIRFYDFDSTQRGEKQIGGKGYSRMLHAKIFCIHTNRGQYCIVGSANATMPAFCTGHNEEFCIMYHSSDIDFEKEAGIATRKEMPIGRIQAMERDNSSSIGNTHADMQLQIEETDANSSQLTLHTDRNLKGMQINIAAYDQYGNRIATRNTAINQRMATAFSENIADIRYCCLTDQHDERISNYQIVSHIGRLCTTSPRQKNINTLIEKIESGNIASSHILEFFSSVYGEVSAHVAARGNKFGNSDHTKAHKKDLFPPMPPSAEPGNSSNTPPASNHELANFAASKVIDAIRMAMSIKANAINEEAMDNEDTTVTVQKSRENTARKEIRIKSGNKAWEIPASCGKIGKAFAKLLKAREKECDVKGSDAGVMDIVYFVIALFMLLKVCVIDIDDYNFDDIISKEEKARKENKEIARPFSYGAWYKELARNLMLEGEKLLEEFAVFCIRHYKPGSIADKQQFSAAAQYAITCSIVYAATIYANMRYDDVRFHFRHIELPLLNLIALFGMPDDSLIHENVGELLAESYNDYATTIQKVASNLRQTNVQKYPYKYYKNLGYCIAEKGKAAIVVGRQ